MVTNKVWFQPSIKNISDLIVDIKLLRNYCKYELFLVGGVVNGGIGKTWDIDIVINGQLILSELEIFLHDIHELALNKHRLLVDVRWFDKKPNLLEQEYTIIRFGKAIKRVGDKTSSQNLFNKKTRLTDLLIQKKAVIKKQGKYIKI